MIELINDQMKIKFDGDSQDINLITFSKTLENINTMLIEINKEQNKITGLNRKVDVRIKAISPGSFQVTIDIMQQLVDSILTTENVTYAASIVTILTSIFGLRKFLKGKKPKSIRNFNESIEIENNKGEITIIDHPTYNIYQTNTTVNDSLSEIYSTLSQDPRVDAFKLFDKTETPVFQSDKSEFESCAEILETQDEEKKSVIELTSLNINKICFEKDYKWQFYYKGYKITAAIKDEEFFKRINDGEPFAKGDSLEVELKITKEYSGEYNTYINRTYDIIKVLKHIPRATQNKLSL